MVRQDIKNMAALLVLGVGFFITLCIGTLIIVTHREVLLGVAGCGLIFLGTYSLCEEIMKPHPHRRKRKKAMK